MWGKGQYMDYLKEVNRIISSSDSVAGLMVVNKEGIVEYYKPCRNFGIDELEFGKMSEENTCSMSIKKLQPTIAQ